MKTALPIFVFLFAMVNTVDRMPMSAAEPINVMTYNIRYLNRNDGDDQWQFRVDAVADAIRTADIIGLQEATRPQIDQLAERLDNYNWYGVGRDDGQNQGEFCPIFFDKTKFALQHQGTFWLGPDPTAVGKPAWKANLPRICSYVVLKQLASEKSMLVLNTHFDHQSGEARLNSATLIRQQAAKLTAQHAGIAGTILMGDLNTRPDSEPLQVLIAAAGEGMRFVDAHESTKSQPTGPDGTWNGFKEIAAGQRIDFILIGQPSLEIVSHQTLDPKTEAGRFASDHLPVLVRIGGL